MTEQMVQCPKAIDGSCYRCTTHSQPHIQLTSCALIDSECPYPCVPVPSQPDTKPLVLSDLQKLVKEWSSHNFPNTVPVDPLLGIGEEVGELMHHYLKRKQNIRGSFEEHTEQIKDSIGDITVYIADFCWRNGFDYQECVDTVWNKVSKRDWIKYPKNGVSQ